MISRSSSRARCTRSKSIWWKAASWPPFIVYIFLANVRTTLISAVAIPTSIVSTFALMAVMGFDLNQITMLALTLMVGIVIDDAIIVLENIYRFMEEKELPPVRRRRSKERAKSALP